jgi:hypothetical protein
MRDENELWEPPAIAHVWEGVPKTILVHPKTGRATLSMDWHQEVTLDASEYVEDGGPEPKKEIVVSPGLLSPLVDEDWYSLEELIDYLLRVYLTEDETVVRISYAV